MSPDAEPSPPTTGLYGQPLQHHGSGLREVLPDGSFIIWQLQKDKNGKDDWRPVQHVPKDNRLEV